MDFTEHIITYYSTESKHGFSGGLALGIVLLIAAVLFWWFSNPSSISKGLSITLLVGALIFGLGGFYAGYTAKNILPEKTVSYLHNQKQFIEKEHIKIENIHKSWWIIRVFWTLFILVGLIIIFTTTRHFYLGIAIGFLVVGTIGHIEEIISYQHNENYRCEVLKVKSSL